MHSAPNSTTAYWLFLVLQIIFVIIFAALGRYDKSLLPATAEDTQAAALEGPHEIPQSKYPRKKRGESQLVNEW